MDWVYCYTTTTTIGLQPFVCDYPGEPWKLHWATNSCAILPKDRHNSSGR